MPPVETVPDTPKTETQASKTVYRIDVLPLALSEAEAVELPGLGTLYAYPVYWLAADEPILAQIERIAKELLLDPILQRVTISTPAQSTLPDQKEISPQWILEKQFLPGVTDNLGKTVEKSIPLLFPNQNLPAVQVASGKVYWLEKPSTTAYQLKKAAEYTLYNPLIERLEVYTPQEATSAQARYHFPSVKNIQQHAVRTIPLNVSDEALQQLSKQGNLALTIEEMQVIRAYYECPETQQKRAQKGLPAWPTDVELEIIAQTWSEHCKHKIFAAQIEYTDARDPDFPKTITIDGLFKTYIAGSTQKLMECRLDLLSVFKDNAGVVQWDDTHAVCFKVETHNSPSALEPYGGALTGIVGVNRDILGTGLGAKPLFNTDVFCFAHPDEPYVTRPTMLPPESILLGVRKGVEDGGNKSGIPTVNGSLFFDARYRAKPLVFCGTGGLLPLMSGNKSAVEKHTQPGDMLVMAGGRVGKDGIHGATFSSEALNQDSPISAVQIGDPITQKRMLDFQMEARDRGLISGITDNGAGGLSSSVGEMAEITNGATIDLEKVPLKYPGLAPYETVISESQERMSISTRHVEELQKLAAKHDVEISVIGQFHDGGTFDIRLNNQYVASLDLEFLHHGLPKMKLKARWEFTKLKSIRSECPKDPTDVLLSLLKSPNICSREAIIRQYDHEVQGRSVVKPLMGKNQTAPSDAAVIQPILGQKQGLVVSNGLCPQFSDWDTYAMAACAIDEAVRNAVAVGADPKSLVLLDNFCWPDPLPSPRNPHAEFKLAQLVRANLAIYDLALAYEAPFISGKDSMKNDFDDGDLRISIPPTLLISAMGKIPDIEQAVTSDFKTPGDHIFILGHTGLHMGGSEYYRHMGWFGAFSPYVNTVLAKELYKRLHHTITQGWIRSCHDLSEGGLAVALAESAFGGSLGMTVSIAEITSDSPELRWDEILFSETPSRFVLTVSQKHIEDVKKAFTDLPFHKLGTVTETPEFIIKEDDDEVLIQTDIQALHQAWFRPPAKCYESGMTA